MAREMTFVEAHDFELPALWIGRDEEFLLAPETGIVSWRAHARGPSQPGDSWQPVPAGRKIPQEGWTHGAPCGCGFCRASSAVNTPGSRTARKPHEA